MPKIGPSVRLVTTVKIRGYPTILSGFLVKIFTTGTTVNNRCYQGSICEFTAHRLIQLTALFLMELVGCRHSPSEMFEGDSFFLSVSKPRNRPSKTAIA